MGTHQSSWVRSRHAGVILDLIHSWHDKSRSAAA
eukprot:SAG31_NODE_40967_length_278_cov_0.849162_1_plen_33_part_01